MNIDPMKIVRRRLTQPIRLVSDYSRNLILSTLVARAKQQAMCATFCILFQFFISKTIIQEQKKLSQAQNQSFHQLRLFAVVVIVENIIKKKKEKRKKEIFSSILFNLKHQVPA
jgi:hypothetical protein